MSCCRARCDISSVGWDGGAWGGDSRTRPSLPLQLALFHVNWEREGKLLGYGHSEYSFPRTSRSALQWKIVHRARHVA